MWTLRKVEEWSRWRPECGKKLKMGRQSIFGGDIAAAGRRG